MVKSSRWNSAWEDKLWSLLSVELDLAYSTWLHKRISAVHSGSPNYSDNAVINLVKSRNRRYCAVVYAFGVNTTEILFMVFPPVQKGRMRNKTLGDGGTWNTIHTRIIGKEKAEGEVMEVCEIEVEELGSQHYFCGWDMMTKYIKWSMLSCTL